MINHITEIFQEQTKGVCLSTIHKAKGLEADNVYVLCKSSMPSKLAFKDWEKIQEHNLMYVAYTRPKKLLGFISEKEIKPMGVAQDPMTIINELAFIERKVCTLLGKEPMTRLENAELARFKLQNKTEIKDIHENDNTITIKNRQTPNNDNDLLNELEKLF